MSERLHTSPENSIENIDATAEAQKNLERIQEAAEKAERDPIQGHIESLSKSAEAQAISGHETNVGDQNTEQTSQQFGTPKELKSDSYNRSLRKIRTHLNVADRTLSRFVHQKTVESVSNGLSKTVARPSAFLGGSLGALIGSAALLYFSKHYGFTYNYTVMLVLFIGGFFIGGLIELLYRAVVRKKTH